MVAVAADDERPPLQVLAAPRVTAGAEDAIEVIGSQGPICEAPDGPLLSDRRPDWRRLLAHGAGGVGIGVATGGVGATAPIVPVRSDARVASAFRAPAGAFGGVAS